MEPSTRELLFGCDEPPEPEWTIQAGPLRMMLRGTRLLHLRCGDAEVWHGVAFLFRDADWGTPLPVLDHIEHEASAGGFRVRLAAHVPCEPPLDLRIAIDGGADGTVRYEGRATPRGVVTTQRTGLCVMHPMACAGQPVKVTHDDGRESRSTFPLRVAPWPPFTSVRALAHEWAPGRWAECRFEGDVFEFEDQRNNADASFKTSSRSVAPAASSRRAMPCSAA